MSTKKKTMTVETFLKNFSGAPLGMDSLAQAASFVEGPLGEAAKAWLEADAKFSEALTDAGFEVG